MNDFRKNRWRMKSFLNQLLPDSQTAKCMNLPLPNSTNIQLWRSKEFQKVYYHGCTRCSSVWSCSICSARISERRKKELLNIFDNYEQCGGNFYFGTFTLSHHLHTDLRNLLHVAKKCITKLTQNRWYQELKLKYRIIGFVKAFEVTYGKNGYHPHFHMVFFSELALTNNEFFELSNNMFDKWSYLVRKEGFHTSYLAFDFRQGWNREVALYLSKWGMANEVTGNYKKNGKFESFTMWQILEKVMDGEDQYKMIFLKYVEAFKGYKQITYSNDLKKRFLIEESDEKLNNKNDDLSEFLGVVPVSFINILNRFNLRYEFLYLVECLGIDQAINDILEITVNIKKMTPEGVQQNN